MVKARKNRLTGTKAHVKSRNREKNGFVTDLSSKCLGMSFCDEWGLVLLLKGYLGKISLLMTYSAEEESVKSVQIQFKNESL